ncbi:MAG: hypothetical protein WBR26_00660 [Candidatus Acidiferrum sp.]
MDSLGIHFSRISKLFLDRDQATLEEALARRQRHAVTLYCGPDVGQSYTLQLAVLTAANIASRCFPNALHVALAPGIADASLLLWPSLSWTFGQALSEMVSASVLVDRNAAGLEAKGVIFGDVSPRADCLRVTFDGWVAKVGPSTALNRSSEREYCSLAGILGGSLAISEIFLSFAEISIEAGRSIVGMSLWRPDLDISDPAALGVPVEFLPRELWALGLGHLGNAYLWALATMPYDSAEQVEIFLNDFDRVEPENAETGLLFNASHIDSYKTRVCSDWLESRGFKTRLIERPFDSNFRCRPDEPRLAFCGFDLNAARRDLATADFLRVIESGLGGTPSNFDTISLHTLPNPRKPEELWPELTPDEAAKRADNQRHAANENAAYARLEEDECGRRELAGKSVAVPFVGATAGTLMTAEILRLLHGGQRYTDTKLTLGDLKRRSAPPTGPYGAKDFVGLKYCDARIAK